MATATSYDPALTLLEARTRYFEDNGFGRDGGYCNRWVHLKIGPVPVAFPNTAERVRAVRYHDLHHVLTGYGTDFVGEAEISAWEVASGCRDKTAAWVLNLSGMLVGLLFDARAVFAAFVRGRYSQNLYDRCFNAHLLAEQVGPMREALGLATPPPPATTRDKLAFAGWLGVSLLMLLVSLGVLGALLVGLAP